MLNGLLVLDLSRVLAGPYCTQLLADLGATVVKIEAPAGDETRAWGPPFVGGESGYFLSVNRGKRSVAVDLKNPAGARLARSLALKADVLVENFKTGDLQRFGLDYASLAGENPRLVYLSITGYGQTGPRASEAGYDAAMQAQTGLMAMTGEAGGGSVKLPVALIDVLTGTHAAVSVLAALQRRAGTGEGAHLDVSLFEVAFASMVNQAQSALLTGVAPRRLGSAHPNIVPYQAFAAADGEVVIAVGNDSQFAKLCRVLGVEALATDERFATNAARVANREVLIGALMPLVGALSRGELVERCVAAGVPTTPVETLPEALEDVQARARQVVVTGEHPSAGRLSMIASPLWHATGPDGAPLDLAPTPGRAPVPPLLGEHAEEVLSGLLGLSGLEIAELFDSGAVLGPVFGPVSGDAKRAAQP